MASFELSNADGAFTFDLTGQVQKDGADAGVWNTDGQARLIVLPRASNPSLPFDPDASAEPSATFDVIWQFNAKNQLVLQDSAGNELVNFNTIGNIPFFSTYDAVLKVRPNSSHAFSFELHGEWDISDTHDLAITIAGHSSVIDGFVQDSRSRFMYHFFDKDNIAINAILGFVGEWKNTTTDGVVSLDFVYKREDGSTDIFSLPGSVVVDRGTNQLAYEYNKENRTYRIQLLGFLRISDDFQIDYTLDRQESRTGELQTGSTTFTIDAVYSNDHFNGDLKLIVRKDDGTPGTTFTIAGSMAAVLGQTHLSVGFAFSQTRNGEQVSTTIAFNGTLEWTGGTVQWSFERNAEQTTISIAASEIRLGSARADARLNIIASDGQIQGVRALFGISF